MTRLYEDLAEWWPVISPPSEYAEEATLYVGMIRGAARRPVREVLELGSGGGNNASHMKLAFSLTLVEPADGMRELSRQLNPECGHVPGDMRTVRLGREFDAVFIPCVLSTEGFAMGFMSIAKPSFSSSSWAQALFLMAG